MQSPTANISLMYWNLWKIMLFIYYTEVYKEAFGGELEFILAAGETEQDRGARGGEAHPWREGWEKGGWEKLEWKNYTPKHPWTLWHCTIQYTELYHSAIAPFLLLFKVNYHTYWEATLINPHAFAYPVKRHKICFPYELP